MKIFIDFDDVIFNTGKFKKELVRIFLNNGVANDVFEKYYYDYPIRQKNGKLKKYDPREHIRRIKESIRIPTADLEKALDKLTGDTREYVFRDVEDFLKNFNKNDSYLVSYAKTGFQESKIKNAGIEKYFKKMVIVDELKSSAIRELFKKDKIKKEEKLYFLDDRIEQIESVKKKYPFIATIFVRRKEGRYNDERNKYCDFEVKNLKQAVKIILNKK